MGMNQLTRFEEFSSGANHFHSEEMKNIRKKRERVQNVLNTHVTVSGCQLTVSTKLLKDYRIAVNHIRLEDE